MKNTNSQDPNTNTSSGSPLSVSQLKKLFETGWKIDPPLLPVLALQTFAGIRSSKESSTFRARIEKIEAMAFGHQKGSAVAARCYNGSPESEWAHQFEKLTPTTVIVAPKSLTSLQPKAKKAKAKNSKAKKSKPQSKNK